MPDIHLKSRPSVYELPSYSLTGDLLGYLRCGLQYRYTRIGKMPSLSPVQLWFGNFVHGVMDEGFRTYKQAKDGGATHAAALKAVDAVTVINAIEARLEAQGLVAWEPWVKTLGYARARVCLSELGPILFPLIHRSEVRLTGARELAKLPANLAFREAERYEMVGVIDVVTDIELAKPDVVTNPIVKLVQEALGTVPSHFEVIIDYKGSRRPPLPKGKATPKHPSLWDQYEWQVLTYADLRGRQAGSFPVKAGLLIYINELLPLASDIDELAEEGKRADTDQVVAASDLKGWRPAVSEQRKRALAILQARAHPEGNQDELNASLELIGTPIPWDVRLRRALRVVSVDDPTTKKSRIPDALKSFDEVVSWIETCRGKEFHGKTIIDSWECNSSDESTCAACDARTWCPAFADDHNKGRSLAPELPAQKERS